MQWAVKMKVFEALLCTSTVHALGGVGAEFFTLMVVELR